MTATIVPLVPRQQAPKTFEDLPFIKSKGRGLGFCYWAVQSTGSYSADCYMGEDYAYLFLELIQCQPTNGNLSLLGSIALDMQNDEAKGIAIGFLHQISLALLVGREAARAAAMAEREAYAGFLQSDRMKRSQRARRAARSRWDNARQGGRK